MNHPQTGSISVLHPLVELTAKSERYANDINAPNYLLQWWESIQHQKDIFMSSGRGGLPVRVSRLTRSFISSSKSSKSQTSKFSLNRAPFVVLGRGVNPAEDASEAQYVPVFAHVVFPVT
ncbi:hypothetical protein ACXD9I_003638 [Yersinia enterocolitica]